MTQFHAHQNLDPETSAASPFVLDVQNSLLDGFATRLVAPLTPQQRGASRPIARLQPTVVVRGRPHTMLTQNLFAMPTALIGASAADCRSQQQDIVAAIDCLLSGV